MSEIKSEVCFILEKLGMSDTLNIYRDTHSVKELLLLIKRDELCEAFMNVMNDEEYDVVTSESEDEDYNSDIDNETDEEEDDDLIEEEYKVTLNKNGFYEMSECNIKNHQSSDQSLHNYD